MSSNYTSLPLRRLAECWDFLRIPLNAEERFHRPGDVPYWGANNIQGYIDESTVAEPVVLLGEDGAPFFDPTRPVAFYVDEPIWPNNHIHVLKPRSYVDGRWLAYALNVVDYSLYIDGSTRDKLTQGAMMDIRVAVPQPVEQVAIADYLDRETAQIDALVEKQERLIATLRERRHILVSRLFDGVVGTGNRLKWWLTDVDDRIGDDWKDWPLLSVSISWGVRRRDVMTSDDSRAEDLSKYKVCKQGDLVLNRMRAFQGALGLAPERGIVSPDYAVISIDPSALDREWLSIVMRSSRFLAEMTSVIRGIGGTTGGNVRTPRINIDDLLNIRVDAPTVAEQRDQIVEIGKSTATIDRVIAKAQSLIGLSTERRFSLIAAAVTGQIDVRSAA